MKAKLVLTTDLSFEKEYEPEETYCLQLNLVLDCGVIYILRENNVDDTNKEKFKDEIEYAINSATLIMNSIPGIKLIVDQSVVEFIEGEEEEIGKFVQRLVVEI
jgi:hypothetical protein